MTDELGRWRRLAMRLVQHAGSAMPGARTHWARAMRCEIDYIADDMAALRWALGCVLASYRARLRGRRPGPRTAWNVAASSVVMLVIGVALHDNAGGQTRPLQPAPDKAICSHAPLNDAAPPVPARAMVQQPAGAAAHDPMCPLDCASVRTDGIGVCNIPAVERGP